jgi:hypothetical protein
MKFSDSNYQKSLSRELNAIVGIDDAFPLPDHVADMVVAAKSVQSSLLRPRRCKKLRPQWGVWTAAAGAFAAWRAPPLPQIFEVRSEVCPRWLRAYSCTSFDLRSVANRSRLTERASGSAKRLRRQPRAQRTK